MCIKAVQGWDMLMTESSKPYGVRALDALTKVNASDEESMVTLAEIQMYLLARDNAFKWFDVIYPGSHDMLKDYPTWIRPLRRLVTGLPSNYDLVETRDGLNTETLIIVAYRTRYSSYSAATMDRLSRPMILGSVTILLNFMDTQRLTLRERVPEDLRTTYDDLHEKTTAAFVVWAAVARPKVMARLGMRERRRAEEGRVCGSGGKCDMCRLLSELKPLRCEDHIL